MATLFRTKIMLQALRDLFSEQDSPLAANMDTFRWASNVHARMGSNVVNSMKLQCVVGLLSPVDMKVSNAAGLGTMWATFLAEVAASSTQGVLSESAMKEVTTNLKKKLIELEHIAGSVPPAIGSAVPSPTLSVGR
jgi:hypothetical protein